MSMSHDRMNGSIMVNSDNLRPGFEIDLHSLTVDECLLKVDEYLYEVYTAGFPCVRLVHGKGTGVLRQAVRRHIAKHPLVKSFRPAFPSEGGDGATVVELAG